MKIQKVVNKIKFKKLVSCPVKSGYMTLSNGVKVFTNSNLNARINLRAGLCCSSVSHIHNRKSKGVI